MTWGLHAATLATHAGQPTGHAAHDILMTMVVAISVGALLIVAARKWNIPTIVLLLAGGILLGPAVLGVIDPDNLGDGLRAIVSLSIGLILFEGGLTLDLRGYRSAPTMIKRLLTIGVVVTWVGAAGAVWLVFRPPVPWAVVAGSLVIVTGPTVIAPLLKRIKISTRLHSILHWEGVLIDPIGVFLAVFCFEWLADPTGMGPFALLGQRVVAGMIIGVAGGGVLTFLVRRKIVPEELINVFALGWAVLVFGAGEAVQPETGLLSVTVAGFIFGLSTGYQIRRVIRFKAELTDLLIGTLFILLAARLTFGQFQDFGLRGALVVAIVMFVIRPLSISLCSLGQDLSKRERVFLSWVAPRGIVAASMASLIALRLEAMAGPDPDAAVDPKFVETFTYSVIIATIFLQGLTAGPLATLLDLRRPQPTGWMIVGAHTLARRLAEFIQRTADRRVIIVDTNARLVRETQDEGIAAHFGDARDIGLVERLRLQWVGNVMAVTDNEDLNVRVCQIWSEVVGTDHVFRCNPTGVEPDIIEEPEEGGGHLVWPRLPRPSILAAELQRGEAIMMEADGNEQAFAELATPVAIFDGARVHLVTDEEMDLGENARTLYVQRKTDYLMRSLRPELIGRTAADDLRELFEGLLDRVVKVNSSVPRDEMVEELLERELAFPTVLGKGVAVPHAYSSSLDSRLCAVAQLPDGIRFSDRDDEPIRLVFLLLSPAGDPEGHLATLADIARLVNDDETRARMMNADSPLEVIRTVRSRKR